MSVPAGITKTSAELGQEFQTRLLEHQKDPEKWRGLQFGHPELDKLTGGLRKGEFAVMAGAQKAGKTTVALSWAEHFSRQIQPDELILYVSLEMNHDALAARVLSNLSDIDVTKFRDLTIEGADYSKLDNGVAKLKDLPILWNVGAYNIDGIEQIVTGYPRGKVRLLAVDYFQLMTSSERGTKRYEQLESLSLRLKQMTLTNDMSVLAVSQQTRDALRNLDRAKDSNTMAGTQALARDCDLMLMILPFVDSSNVEIPHMRKLHVSLARNSMADVTLDAVFSGAYCRFGAPMLEEETVSVPPQRTAYWDS